MKKKYRVKKGDNFFSIAEKLYGNSAYAATLIWANPGIYVLHPGMILKTPQIDTSTGELPVMGNAAWQRILEGEKIMHPAEIPDMAKVSREVFGGENTIKSLPMPDEEGIVFYDPTRTERPEDYNPYMQLDERLQDKYLDKLMDELYPEMPTTGKDGLREYPTMDEEWLTVDDKVKWREEMKEVLRDILFPKEEKPAPPVESPEMEKDWDAIKQASTKETDETAGTPPRMPEPTKEDPFFMSMIEESPDVLGLGGDETETDDSFVVPINEKAAAKKVLDAWLASVMDDKTLDYRTKQLAKEGHKRALMAIENGTYTLEDIQRIYGTRVNTQPEEKEEKKPFINILGSIDLSNNPLLGPRPDYGGDVSTGGPKVLYKPTEVFDPKEEAKKILKVWYENSKDLDLDTYSRNMLEKGYVEAKRLIDSGVYTFEKVWMMYGPHVLKWPFEIGEIPFVTVPEEFLPPIPSFELVFDTIEINGKTAQTFNAWATFEGFSDEELIALALLSEENQKIFNSVSWLDAFCAGWIMHNRKVDSEFPNDLLSVLAAENQFIGFGGHLQGGAIYATNVQYLADPDTNAAWFSGQPRARYWTALYFARLILRGYTPDPTMGARFFVDAYIDAEGNTKYYEDGRTRFAYDYWGPYYSLEELSMMDSLPW